MEGGLDFEAVARDDGATTIVSVAGDIDLATSPTLLAVCTDSAQRNPETVRIDLARVGFLDSSGINVLVQVKKRLESQGSVMVLHRPTDQTRRVLEIAGLNKFFTVSDQTPG
jgi:anti-anti-sigma factor